MSDSDSDNDSRSPQVQEEGRESVSQEATVRCLLTYSFIIVFKGTYQNELKIAIRVV